MSTKLLTIQASTVNGEIQDNPKTFTFKCDEIVPIGIQDVIEVDINSCTRKKRVFVVRHGLDLFGLPDLNDINDYNSFLSVNCGCKSNGITVNGCYLTFNNCILNN